MKRFLVLLAVLASCSSPTAPPTSVSSVTISSDASGSMAVGATRQLVAVITPEAATNKAVTWNSSDSSAAAVNSSGLVTAKAAGDTVITVTTTDGGFKATASIHVSASNVAVTSVLISSEASGPLGVGATRQLVATVSPAVATNKSVTWSSSKSSVATVSSGGLVTAKAVGETVITVTTTDGGFKATASIQVALPTSGVTVSAGTTLLQNGGSQQLTATVFPATAENKDVTWKTSDAGVATVSNTGLVTAKAMGTATITVTTVVSGHTAQTTVTVADLLINEVVNPGPFGDSAAAVEIYNPTSSTVNLSAYKLRSRYGYIDRSAQLVYLYDDLKSFDLPSLSIPSGGYAAIRSRIWEDTVSGGSTVYLADDDSRYPYVAPNADSVELLRSGATVDFVRWGTNTDVPTSGAGAFSGAAAAIPSSAIHVGASWHRDLDHTNTHQSSDWTVNEWSTLGGPNDVTSDDDSDGDGIPDSSEKSGATFAGMDLYGMGARTSQRDIFIHLDYMVKGSVQTTDVGIIPRKAALDKVVAAFAAKNIAVHFDVGDLFGTGTANDNLDGRSHAVTYNGSIAIGASSGYANVYQYKVDSMPLAKNKVFFYMLFADSQLLPAAGGSGGIANMPGNTSIITLGHWNLRTQTTAYTNQLVNYQAATIMHELGHNLGLHHGGDDEENWKPNYFSIMNYLYSYTGLPTTPATYATRYYNEYEWLFSGSVNALNSAWRSQISESSWIDSCFTDSFLFTYSNGTGAAIDENSADENAGIGRSGSQHIDFNNDGDNTDTGVGVDIRYNLDPDLLDVPTRTVLKDFDDWSAISSVFQRTYEGTWFGSGPRAASTTGETIRKIFWDTKPTTSNPCLNPFVRISR